MSAATEALAGPAGQAKPVTAQSHVPGLPAWLVPRSRLDRQLSRGSQRPLTIVTGPAGAGKTVAIASWARTRPGRRPVAWASADRSDNQPAVFWRHLTGALRQAGLDIPAGLVIRDSHRAGPEYLSRLAGELAGQELPVVLVLDDMHLVTSSGPHEDLARLSRLAGPGLRLVLASRAASQLPLHKFLLAGDLSQIGSRDLAFTTAEARQLAVRHGVSLSLPAVTAMRDRTAGWAAGLRLAAVALQNCADPDQLATGIGLADCELISYLASDLLSSLAPGTAELLLKTSVLERVNGELAVELTGDPEAGGRLAALADDNVLVQPLGRGWYRYCPLLAQALTARLQRESWQESRDLRRRAARWLRQRGQLTEAVNQAADAADWPLAARTVIDELAVPDLVESGRQDAVAARLRIMPDAVAAAAPALVTVTAAIAVRDHRSQDAAGLLTAADRMLAAPGGGEPGAAGPVTVRLAAEQVRLALARQTGDLDSAEAAVVSAGNLSGSLPGELLAWHPEALPRVQADRALIEFWRGQPESAAALLDGIGGPPGRTCGAERGQRADWAGLRALIDALQGRLAGAEEAAARAARAPERDQPHNGNEPARTTGGTGTGGSDAAAADLALACVDLQRGQLTQAGERIAGASRALTVRPDRLLSAVADLVSANHAVATGQIAPARARIARARGGWQVPGWLADRLWLAETAADDAGRRRARGPGRAGRETTDSGAACLRVPVITERLSHREREVLELLSGMLTTDEIASELYVSVNTVKTHVRSILRKLGAARRGEAVRRARELRLLAAVPRSAR